MKSQSSEAMNVAMRATCSTVPRGLDPVKPHAPEAFGALLSSEIARWGKVIREANVKVE